METRTRILEKSIRSNKTAPKDAECECYDIVTGLILCEIPQFTRVMGDDVVKIPDGFVLEHAKMLRGVVSLEPCDSQGRLFKVMLTIITVGKQSTLSFGTGWKEFRANNRLQKGDLLIFSLVGLSQFVVYILRGHSKRAKRALISDSTASNPITRVYVRKSSSPKRISKKSSEGGLVEQTNQDTYFEKRLLAGCRAKGRDNRRGCFELPQAFLRLHAGDIGDELELVVSNRSKVWLIKPCKCKKEAIWPVSPRIYLVNGWGEFLEDNGLQEGDLLGFSLVAHSKFLVTIVSRASGEKLR